MQIQAINNLAPLNTQYKKNSGAVKKSNNNLGFKGYESFLKDVINTKIVSEKQATSLFSDLYYSLINTPNITKMPNLATFTSLPCTWDVGLSIDQLTRPIKEVPSFLRDIVFKSEDENISLIKIGSEDALCMYNLGKFGFFNCIFNSQDAKTDIRFAFQNDCDKYEIGSNKDGGLKVRQETRYSWAETILYSNSVYSYKDGDYDNTPIIWPF